MAQKYGIAIDYRRCIGCGSCVPVCPQKCITEGEPYKIDPVHCLQCGACFEACPAEAIKRLHP